MNREKKIRKKKNMLTEYLISDFFDPAIMLGVGPGPRHLEKSKVETNS